MSIVNRVTVARVSALNIGGITSYATLRLDPSARFSDYIHGLASLLYYGAGTIPVEVGQY
jgi:hypothetical protein